MRISLRVVLAAAATAALGTGATLWATAAGAAHTATAPTITLLYGAAPDYLDPQEGYTTQSAEATWVSYLGLYGYAHAAGAAGGVVIPALATALPKITGGGKTYTMTLRPNLVYSNGKKVQATDFAYSIERALKINWGGDPYYTGSIVGAAAYQKGTAKTISGIVANNATRTIVVHLLAAYGPFLNILSFPSSGFVPAGTPMKTATTTMPAGVGPYMITNVNPGKSWEGQINPNYAKEAIPGIPVAHVNVQARVEANTTTETEDVLNNTADVFDTGDAVSPALLAQVKAKASNRYGTTPVVQTFYFFMNSKVKPFNSLLVREAVIISIDQNALSKLDSGNLVPGCYFLPIGLVGHPTKPCPYGNPAISPTAATITRAKKLIAQAGDTGAAVTVYSQERQPRTQYVTYYASVLQELGFKVNIKQIVDANYFPTVGNLKLEAQTGFADWLEDFPNPADFYLLLDKNSIQPVNNQNFSQVDDPKIQNAITKLDALPPSQLPSHAADWQALDYYVAQKAYEAVYGYPVDPTFVSTRINFKAAKVQPTYGWDWTSFQLNS